MSRNLPKSSLQKPRVFRETFGAPHCPNSYLKLKPLHSKAMGPKIRHLNRCGAFVAGKAGTLAQVPSLYYWLSERCGVCFDEADLLVEEKRLFVRGQPVKLRADLEFQVPWEELESDKYGVEIMNLEDEKVLALDRARHREYWHLNMSAETTLHNSMTDPRSFLHCSMLPLRSGRVIITPPGLPRSGGVCGESIVTNDVSIASLLDDPYCGTSGVVEFRFLKGSPPEVVREVREQISEAVDRMAKETEHLDSSTLSPLTLLPVRSSPTPLPASHTGSIASEFPSEVASQFALASTPEETTSLLFKGPWVLDESVFEQMRPLLQTTKCWAVGPFTLPADIAERQTKMFDEQEVHRLFDFIKVLKKNRVIQHLRDATLL
jgi:hypothetical protein